MTTNYYHNTMRPQALPRRRHHGWLSAVGSVCENHDAQQQAIAIAHCVDAASKSEGSRTTTTKVMHHRTIAGNP